VCSHHVLIVITAPTALISSQVLSRVLEAGSDARVVARDPSTLSSEAREKADVIVGSHRDIDILDRALRGADQVFWVVPADSTAASVYHAYLGFSIPGAEAVARNRVARVVTVSALGRRLQRYAG